MSKRAAKKEQQFDPSKVNGVRRFDTIGQRRTFVESMQGYGFNYFAGWHDANGYHVRYGVAKVAFNNIPGLKAA